MKKFVCILLILMILTGTALACDCAPSATVRLTAQQMTDMLIYTTREELDALAGIAMGTDGDCTVRKTALLNVMLRNHGVLKERFDEVRMAALVEYIGHCCCRENCTETAVTQAPVVTPAPTVQPTRQPQTNPQRPQPTPRPCQHTGGTHENRGTCTICGEVYQDHSTPGEWQSNNGTWHDRFCSFPGCGVKMGNGRHVWDGVTYATSAEGLKKVYCTVCHQYSWIRSGSTQATTQNENNCCGCCNGKPCPANSGCNCGCDDD